MNTLPFCSVELAEHIERAEAQMISTATEAARRRLDTGAQFVIRSRAARRARPRTIRR